MHPNAPTGRVPFVIFVVSFMAGTSANGQTEEAAFIPDTYLITGTVEITVADSVKEIFDIAIARTPERVLTIAKERDSSSNRFYSYTSQVLSHGITVDYRPQSKFDEPQDLLNAQGLEVQMLVRQEALPDNRECNFVAGVETGLFSQVCLGVFFGRPTWGHSPAALNEQLVARTEDPVQITSAHGVLEFSESAAAHRIELKSKASDQISMLSRSGTLSEFRSPLFKNGIASITETCQFSTRLDQLDAVPWSARCSKLTEGSNGEKILTSGKVRIASFISVQSTVDAVIDNFLNQIPSGTPVVTSDKLTYEWANGTIQVVEDESAIKVAEELTFTPPGPWWEGAILPLTMACAAIVLILGYRFWKQNG